MLRAALGFLILAFIAYFLGFYNLAGFSLELGRVILGVFLVLAVVSLIVGLAGGSTRPRFPT